MRLQLIRPPTPTLYPQPPLPAVTKLYSCTPRIAFLVVHRQVPRHVHVLAGAHRAPGHGQSAASMAPFADPVVRIARLPGIEIESLPSGPDEGTDLLEAAQLVIVHGDTDAANANLAAIAVGPDQLDGAGGGRRLAPSRSPLPSGGQLQDRLGWNQVQARALDETPSSASIRAPRREPVFAPQFSPGQEENDDGMRGGGLVVPSALQPWAGACRAGSPGTRHGGGMLVVLGAGLARTAGGQLGDSCMSTNALIPVFVRSRRTHRREMIIYQRIRRYPAGDAKVAEIGDQIHRGAMVFMRREYTMLGWFCLVLIVVLWYFLGYKTALSFIAGAAASAAAGLIGMRTATRANVRTTVAAHTRGRDEALSVAFFGGSIMGLAVASLGLLGLGTLYLFFGGDPETAHSDPRLRDGSLQRRPVLAGRWRHLHQECRRRGGPGGQGRSRYPRGRPVATPGSSPTTWATTWATWRAWARTSSSPTAVR